jgi:hypothetical protein
MIWDYLTIGTSTPFFTSGKALDFAFRCAMTIGLRSSIFKPSHGRTTLLHCILVKHKHMLVKQEYLSHRNKCITKLTIHIFYSPINLTTETNMEKLTRGAAGRPRASAPPPPLLAMRRPRSAGWCEGRPGRPTGLGCPPAPFAVQGGRFGQRLATGFGDGDVEDAHSRLRRRCNGRLRERLGGTAGREAWA